MPDSLKKLFSRMSKTKTELDNLREAVDESTSTGRNLDQAHQRSTKQDTTTGPAADDGGTRKQVQQSPAQRRRRGGSDKRSEATSGDRGEKKKVSPYQELINDPLLSDSPPPKPAPKDAPILPFQDPVAGVKMPEGGIGKGRGGRGHDARTLPRNWSPGPLPPLPGIVPSRHNPNVSDMGSAFPNLVPNENRIETPPPIPKQPETVLGTPFTATEALNIMRLGWIALEFLRDDKRPCCIIEVSKSNQTMDENNNSANVGAQLAKAEAEGLKNQSLERTTMIDASDPRTISMLMQSDSQEGIQNPEKLPRIMFENEAFLNVRRKLDLDLAPALAEALTEEPPRVVKTSQGKSTSDNTQKDSGDKWMKHDEAARDQRSVQREFVDHDGKMWRITSIDVTPDPGKDPLAASDQRGFSAQGKGDQIRPEADWDDSTNPQPVSKSHVYKGWKVFYVESVFPAPVGVDWLSSYSPTIPDTGTFPTGPTTESRPSGNQTINRSSRTSTFQDTPSSGNIKKSLTRTSTSSLKWDSSGPASDVRRMSIPEESINIPTYMATAMENAAEQTSETNIVDTEEDPETPILQIKEGDRELDTKNVLGARVTSQDVSQFVGLGGTATHIDGYSSTTDSKEDVSGNSPGLQTPDEHYWTKGRSQSTLEEMARQIQTVPTESIKPVLDWTRGDMMDTDPPELGEHYRLLRAIPWENTPFGALSTWSRPLRLYANTIMTFPHATTIYWGPEFLQLYNVPWKAIVQDRHPAQLGLPFEQGWPELRNIILPLIKQCYSEGISTRKVDEPLFIDRQVLKEECYFHFHLGPLLGESDTAEGVMEQAFERTSAVLGERRVNTIRAILEASEKVRDLEQEQFWKTVINVLAANPKDFPFALIYIHQRSEECFLEGSLGVIDSYVGKQVAPLLVTLKRSTSSNESTPYARFSESNTTGSDSVNSTPPPKMVPWEKPPEGEGTYDFLFTKEMIEASETGSLVYKDLTTLPDNELVKLDGIKYRGFGDPCAGAVVAPIQPTSTRTHGYLILGLNPRRPYDHAYMSWLNKLTDHLSTTVARVKLMTEDFKNAMDAELALVERRKTAELHDRLMEATEQLKDSELMFTKFAESIPIGMTILNDKGDFMFVNDAWYEITSYSREELLEKWINLVYEEDRAHVVKTVQEAFKNERRTKCEFRVGRNADPSIKRGWKRWVIKTIDPDFRKGKLRGFFATLVDVTSIRIAEEYQKELTQTAIENQTRQENFIDITSHELRNPLSAILQSAEAIIQEIRVFQKTRSITDLDENSIIDSARTILLCVNHQTRIIEDILTVSKLDAMLLTVTPVQVQIDQLIMRSLSIFDDEVKRKDIKLGFDIGQSYRDLDVDWVYADPSRVTQVLVNLITNAIKFTALVNREKFIRVTLGCSITPPLSSDNMPFLPIEDDDIEDVTNGPEWGTGQVLYIILNVKDNGLGIKQEWQDRLFQRFKQVPRTHVTYGGSGLGLFICKKLCHVQGGNIGVFSVEDNGSLFTFFIKTRRSEPVVVTPHRISSWPSKVDGTAKKIHDAAQAKEAESNRNEQLTSSLHNKSPTTSEESQEPPPLILIVEDNLINQRVLQQQLTREGFATLVAQNGKEAYDIIMSSKFFNQNQSAEDDAQEIAAVLMDMEMPIMDGITATKLVRKAEEERDDVHGGGRRTRTVPIIGISANARREQLAQMEMAGMDGTIAKPFRIADLVVTLRGFLAEKRGEIESGANVDLG